MTEFSPFCCPIFLGYPKASGCCFQSERLLYGREPDAVEGGTGKAEAAKLPGAGIGPKQCPENARQKKGKPRESAEVSIAQQTPECTSNAKGFRGYGKLDNTPPRKHMFHSTEVTLVSIASESLD